MQADANSLAGEGITLSYDVNIAALAGNVVISVRCGPMAQEFALSPDHFAKLLAVGANKVGEAMAQRGAGLPGDGAFPAGS